MGIQDEKLARSAVAEGAERARQNLRDGGWWHSIDLGDRITPGATNLEDLQAYWAEMGLPGDLRGKRLLDIGCWDGFFSFQAERQGAEVMAVDCWRPPNFFKAHEALNSRVEFREMSVYEVSRRNLGTFDFVLFLGVLYHLRHPLLGLERVCEVTKERAIIETHVTDDFFVSEHPTMEFYEHAELAEQYDNWWGPNVECLERMTRAAGFVRYEQFRRSHARVAIRVSRDWEPQSLGPEPSIHISTSFNSTNWESTVPVSGRYSFLGIYAKGLPTGATRETIKLHVGPFGTAPIYLGESEFEGYKQINAAVPPGLDPGTVSLWLEVQGERSNEMELQLTAGSDW